MEEAPCLWWCRLAKYPPPPSSALPLTLVLSRCLSHCLGEVSPWLPHLGIQLAMPPLLASLTDLPGRFLRLLERSTKPCLQSLLCEYTTNVPLLALHEAIRVLGEVTGKTPTHLCDTWRWLALEGELYAVSDLQAMLTTNGILITVTADVKTAMGVQIITHCPVAMAQSVPLLAFAQTGTPPLGSFYCGGTPSSGAYMATSSEQDLDSYWASRRRTKRPSPGIPNSPNWC